MQQVDQEDLKSVIFLLQACLKLELQTRATLRSIDEELNNIN